jgi:hypothetical protein
MRTAHGVTTIKGVRWLVQNQSLTNAIGLPGVPEFSRGTYFYKYNAPHNLDLNVKSTPQLETDLKVIESDPVARLFLPTLVDPFGEELMVKYAEQPDVRVIERLTHLWGNGVWARIQTFKRFHRGSFNRQLAETNILPIIFYDTNVIHQRVLDEVICAPLQNRLLLFGDNTPVLPVWSVQKIESLKLRLTDLTHMDLPAVGSLYLRNCMRA